MVKRILVAVKSLIGTRFHPQVNFFEHITNTRYTLNPDSYTMDDYLRYCTSYLLCAEKIPLKGETLYD